MADPEQVPKQDQRMGFDELAEAPLEALGLASGDAAALKQALGIRIVRELADHRLVKRGVNWRVAVRPVPCLHLAQ